MLEKDPDGVGGEATEKFFTHVKVIGPLVESEVDTVTLSHTCLGAQTRACYIVACPFSPLAPSSAAKSVSSLPRMSGVFLFCFVF